MPFHNYTPKSAKSLFKASAAPSILSPQSPSRITKPQAIDRKPSPLSRSLKENLERTRALVASIKKEKYDTDLELSRMGEKAAAKARLEAAQRAALDDELREDALDELRKQEKPQVIEKLKRDLEPTIRAELLSQLTTELRPKVHAELRTEIMDELTQQIKTELKEDQDLRDEAIEELKEELREELAPVMKEELYPDVIGDLKDEYRVMVLEQLKGELAEEAAAAAAQVNGTNGHYDDSLDPALCAESEASDIFQAPSELAAIAKRRFSDTFQGDDPETRKKKLRMVNSDGQPPVKAGSLPPFGTFALYGDADIQPIDESLEEGEQADVEDEADDRVARAIETENLEERIEEVDEVVIPEDLYVEADDQLSRPNSREEMQSDEDAAAEPEDLIVSSHGEDLAPPEHLSEESGPPMAAQDVEKSSPGHVEDTSQLLRSTRILRSADHTKDIFDIVKVNEQARSDELQEEDSFYTLPNQTGLQSYDDSNNPNSNSNSANHQDSSALSEIEDEDEDENEQENRATDEWNYSDPNDPDAPPYYDSDRFGEGVGERDEEETDEEVEEEDEQEEEEDEDQDTSGAYLDHVTGRQYVPPYGHGREGYASLDAGDGDNDEDEDEEEEYADEYEGEEEEEEEGGEEEEADNDKEAGSQAVAGSIFSQAGGNQDEPIELDSD